MDSDREILRLRDRVHRFAAELAEVRLLTHENRDRLEKIDGLVSELATKDAIAEAVAEKLHERGGTVMNRATLFYFGIIGACSVGGLVLGIVAAMGTS